MAEVVTVPIVGKVKQSWLYIGGALVAGIVGYAWWTRATLVEDETVGVELPATDYMPPTVVDSGISVGGAAQGEPIARTNVEWRSMAQEQGEALGFTQTVMQSAIGKYLGKSHLNPTETAAILSVVAILGQPPTGGPYSVLSEPFPEPSPSAASVPATPTGLSFVGATGGYAHLVWNPVAGADRYLIRGQAVDAAGTPIGAGGPPWPETQPSHQAKLASPGRWLYEVRSQNAAGVSPPATVTFNT